MVKYYSIDNLMRYSTTWGKAHLLIRFKRFDNPGGKGDNGQCCDGRFIICPSKCDHRFVVCIDRVYGRLDTSSCPYGKKMTSEIKDQDSIIFRDFIGNEKNPMIFDFNSWPGRVRIKIGVWDQDDGSNSDDLVDFLKADITMNPATSMATAVVQRLAIRDRVTLNVDVMVFCGPNSYGSSCSIICVPQNDASAGYTCDLKTGSKICLDGWTGESCDVSVDDCLTARCQHEAICVDAHLGYSCICPPGFAGKSCEIDIDECASSPCRNNGTCTEGEGTFSCTCVPGWTGVTCDVDLDECFSSPCVRGTCTDLFNDFVCSCPEGYTGKICESDIDECLEEICANGANCTNLVPGFQCACAQGFTGTTCNDDVDECLDNPCYGAATCVNTHGSFQCLCPPDYTGEDCKTQIDDCAEAPCEHGGTCTDDVLDFRCACSEDWTGPTCNEYVDRCTKGPCQNGATCKDLGFGTELICQCAMGWDGPLCEQDTDECRGEPCSNGGTCTNEPGTFSCSCPEGWTGALCTDDVDECELLARQEEQNQNQMDNLTTSEEAGHAEDYTSRHQTNGFESDFSQNNDNESLLACHHAGVCANVDGGFLCQCLQGWEGARCQDDVDECMSDPCLNRGLCSNTPGNFSCACLDAWTGQRCEEDVNECKREPCAAPARCVNTQGGFTCLCPRGWKGNACDEDVNECLGQVEDVPCEEELDSICGNILVLPCQNSGTCHNTPGGFTCTCTAGWTGQVCDQDVDECSAPVTMATSAVPLTTPSTTLTTAHIVAPDGSSLTDDDDRNGTNAPVESLPGYTTSDSSATPPSASAEQLCQHGGTCNNIPGSFSCSCSPHWQGDLCDEDVDECAQSTNPCHNGGACTNYPGAFNCTCVSPWDGPLCTREIDECRSQPCANNGTCISRRAADGGGFQCLCPRGWRGSKCEQDRDECALDPCLNNGTCSNELGGFLCTCPDDVIGLTCDNETKLDYGVGLPLYFKGWLKSREKVEVQKGIQQFLEQYGEFRNGLKIRASVQTSEMTSADESKEPLTEVSISLKIENVTLSQEEVTEIFNRIPPHRLESYFPLPFFFGDVGGRVVMASTSAKAFPVPWYYILAGSLALALVITAIVILCRVKHAVRWWCLPRKKSDASIKFAKNGTRNPAFNADLEEHEPPMEGEAENG
nr:hypothetical protein BaRGS_028132 [Batillaria attramentaria]